MIRGKKWIAAAVSMSAVLVLLSACSGGKTAVDSPAQSSASTDPSKQQEITLTVFSNLANYSGNQPGWFAKVIKDKFNIKLNIIGGGQQKEATMLASGDVGDIQVAINVKDAIKADLLLDWNKNGLLEKYGQDIKKYAGQALEANSKQFGGGTGSTRLGIM